MLQKKASFHPFLPLIPKISINFGIRIFCRTIASSFLPSPKGANRSNTGCGSPLCTHEHEYLCPGTWATMPGHTGAFNRQSRLKVPKAPGKVGQSLGEHSLMLEMSFLNTKYELFWSLKCVFSYYKVGSFWFIFTWLQKKVGENEEWMENNVYLCRCKWLICIKRTRKKKVIW